MNSLELILGYKIEPGTIDDPQPISDFVYPSFDAVMQDVRQLEPITKAHGCAIRYYASTLQISSQAEVKEISKNVNISVERWIDNYGTATLIEIDVSSRDLAKQISVGYVDVKKIAAFKGLKVHSPRDLFKHLHFKPSGAQPTEDRYGETLPLTDIPSMLEIAFSKLDLSDLSSLIMKKYALVEMTKTGEAILRESSEEFSAKYAKKILTPKMFARYSAGDIYQVQFRGEGRDRVGVSSSTSTRYVGQLPPLRL